MSCSRLWIPLKNYTSSPLSPRHLYNRWWSHSELQNEGGETFKNHNKHSFSPLWYIWSRSNSLSIISLSLCSHTGLTATLQLRRLLWQGWANARGSLVWQLLQREERPGLLSSHSWSTCMVCGLPVVLYSLQLALLKWFVSFENMNMFLEINYLLPNDKSMIHQTFLIHPYLYGEKK